MQHAQVPRFAQDIRKLIAENAQVLSTEVPDVGLLGQLNIELDSRLQVRRVAEINDHIAGSFIVTQPCGRVARWSCYTIWPTSSTQR